MSTKSKDMKALHDKLSSTEVRALKLESIIADTDLRLKTRNVMLKANETRKELINIISEIQLMKAIGSNCEHIMPRLLSCSSTCDELNDTLTSITELTTSGTSY